MKNFDNLTEYRSVSSEIQNLTQNHNQFDAQVTEMEAMLKWVKETRDGLKESIKKTGSRLDELTTILSQEIDEIAKEFEEVVEKNDQLEMRGFQSDEEQKELIDCFQEEEKLFAALNTYADELKISHGYTKKQRNVIYKGKVQQVEPMPSE